MARIPRKSDGRRIFTDAFKRKQIARIRRGDVTVAALGRELGIAPSLLHRWKRRMSGAGPGSDVSDGRSTPVGDLGTARYIRELQTLVGKQLVELELVRAELSALKRGRGSKGTSRM